MPLASANPKSSQLDWLPPSADDEADPELVRLERRPPFIQLLLILLVMTFTGVVAWIYRLDLLYFFADETPVQIGAIEELARQIEQQPDYLDRFGSNVYAHLAGIPQRRAVTATKQYHQLVGAAVFVEEDRPQENPILREARLRRPDMANQSERTYIEGNGRFLSLDDLGRKHRGLIDFYEQGYNLHFCSKELSRQQQQYVRHLREELRSRLETQLMRPPSEAELDQAVSQEYPCQHGFLFQFGSAPRDQVGYLALYGFLLLIEGFSVVFVVNWVRRLRSSLRDQHR